MNEGTGKEAPKAFDPHKRQHRWKLWTRFYSSRAGGDVLVVFWKRVAIVAGVVAVVAWFGGTLGVWALVRYRRGFTTARYVDLALPWRMHYYRGEIAQGYQVSAEERLKAGDANGAIGYLSAALAMAPSSLAVRHELAVAQSRAGLRMGAFLTLKDGAKDALLARDEGYLRDAFAAAFVLQDDDAAAQLGASLLPAAADEVRVDLFVAFQTATALYNRAHFAEAAQLALKWHLDGRPEGQVMLARCEWGEGHRDAAVQRLASAVTHVSPKNEIYLALAQFARARGDPVEERRQALLRWLSDQQSFAARVDYLYTLSKTGEKDTVTREADAYLADLKSNVAALALLDAFAAEVGRPDIAAKVLPLAQAAGTPKVLTEVRLAQADVSGKQFAAALKACDGPLQSETGATQNPILMAITAGLKATAMFGAKSDAAGAAFNLFVGEAGQLQPPEVLWFATQLNSVGAKDEQRRVLEAARKLRPDDQAILSAEVRADAEAGDRAAVLEHLPALLRTRVPGTEALEAALKVLTRPEDAEVAAQVKEASRRSAELF